MTLTTYMIVIPLVLLAIFWNYIYPKWFNRDPKVALFYIGLYLVALAAHETSPKDEGIGCIGRTGSYSEVC